MRAISTVLDVAVFLLLVSTAVATLSLAPAGGTDVVTVDERANVLVSTTTEVEYTLRGARRRSHRTVASLLARAAVANASIDGKPLSAGEGDFNERIRTESRVILGESNRTQVAVRWQPYRGAPLQGTFRVGTPPPSRRDVSVATVTVPAPARSVSDAARARATDDGYRGVATVTARATVDAVLPRNRVGLSTGPESPATQVARSRFHSLATATGVSVETQLSAGNVSGARRRIVEGLTDRFVQDMRERFATPGDAAGAVRVGTVRLTLRRWEP